MSRQWWHPSFFRLQISPSFACGKSQYLGAIHDVAYGLQPPSCALNPSGALGYTDLLLELEFEVMGLNWAVGLPGHFAGTFASMYIFG